MNRQLEEKLMEVYREGFKDGYEVGYETGQRDITENNGFYDQGVRMGVKMLNNLLKKFVRVDTYVEVLPYIEQILETHGEDSKEEEEEEIKWNLTL